MTRSAMRKAMPRKRQKSMIRSAPKSTEKQIVESAQHLYDNPFRILPEYSDPISEKRFKKIFSVLSKINKYKNDTNKLEKWAKKRTLPSAVAGTLLIAHSKKVPFLATANFASTSAMYAQRGHAPLEYLVASQHIDDPFLRLLGIRDIALKYGLHVYSWDEGFQSTGLIGQPPQGFISFILKTTELDREDDTVHCPHLRANVIKEKKESDSPYLHIIWNSAHITFGICETCASKKRNLIFSITKYLIEPDVRNDFTVSVVGEIVKLEKKQFDHDTIALDEYFSGSIPDYGMIKKNMLQKRETLQTSETIQYVLNDVSFGDRAEEFIGALHPNIYERQALQFFLNKSTQSIVVSNATVNTVLEMFWKDLGKEFLQTILQDDETIEKLVVMHESPSVIVNTAFQLRERRTILQKLPLYRGLPDVAQFANNLARIYRTDGVEKMISEIKQRPNSPQGKAMAYAFLQSVGKAEDKRWMFSKVEIELGEFLTTYVNHLLNEKPEKYHAAFQDLLAASGLVTSLDTFIVT